MRRNTYAAEGGWKYTHWRMRAVWALEDAAAAAYLTVIDTQPVINVIVVGERLPKN